MKLSKLVLEIGRCHTQYILEESANDRVWNAALEGYSSGNSKNYGGSRLEPNFSRAPSPHADNSSENPLLLRRTPFSQEVRPVKSGETHQQRSHDAHHVCNSQENSPRGIAGSPNRSTSRAHTAHSTATRAVIRVVATRCADCIPAQYWLLLSSSLPDSALLLILPDEFPCQQ